MKELPLKIARIPLDMIRPIPWLPEREELGDIVSLARSIKAKNDVDIPVKVRPNPNGYYERVWGKRRIEAAKLAGLREISCIVEDLNDEEVLRQHAIENIHRKDKNCIEEAEFFALWRRRLNTTYDRIAEILGIQPKYIYNRIALLNLPPTLKEKLKKTNNGSFGVYHGLLLLKVKDPLIQEKLGNEILEYKLTTRELEKRINEILHINSNKTETPQNSMIEEKNSKGIKFKYIDLTLPLSSVTYNPLFPPIEIRRVVHNNRKFTKIQRITLPTHFGTHIDSPHLFVKGGIRLEKLPIEHFMGPGVVISIPKGVNEPIRLNELNNGGPRVIQGDMVFFHVGWAKKFGTELYTQHPYLTEAVVNWLIDKKVKIVGMDTPTIEIPYHMRDPNFRYPLHRLLLRHNILIVEGIGNMEEVAGKRVFFYVMPLIIRAAESHLVKLFAKVPIS